MKKLSLLITILAVTIYSKAQNDIIYQDFEPDLVYESIRYNYDENRRLWVDIDGDSIPEISFRVHYQRVLTTHIYMDEGWAIGLSELQDIDTTTDLSNIPEYWWREGVYSDWWFSLWPNNDLRYRKHQKLGVRKQVGSDFYYGWMDVRAKDTTKLGLYNVMDDKRYIYVDRVAFCNIPNYPLHWGQTSLPLGVEENNETAFAIIRPNPASGLITITDAQLAEARLYSVTGQLVAVKQGNGTESLNMDVSGLPSGLYFVAAIGEDGSRNVLKVVKE